MGCSQIMVDPKSLFAICYTIGDNEFTLMRRKYFHNISVKLNTESFENCAAIPFEK